MDVDVAWRGLDAVPLDGAKSRSRSCTSAWRQGQGEGDAIAQRDDEDGGQDRRLVHHAIRDRLFVRRHIFEDGIDGRFYSQVRKPP